LRAFSRRLLNDSNKEIDTILQNGPPPITAIPLPPLLLSPHYCYPSFPTTNLPLAPPQHAVGFCQQASFIY
jgi:hypothetical protein